MKLVAILRSFFRAVIFRSRMEREMDAELRFHLDSRVDDLVAAGLPRDEAEWRARREFGDPLRWKEEGREARGLRLINEFTGDLRYGARALRRSPGFALAAVISLALGIGANTAIFSLLDLMLLKPLPVREPGRLVQIVSAGERGRSEASNYPWFREIAARTDLFSEVIAVRQNLFKVEVGGQLEPVTGQFVTGNYHRALGIHAILGRTLVPDDQRDAASNPVAVISYGYWQRRFGGDPNVLGRSIIVDLDPYTIVGVTPPEFFGLQVGWTMDVTMPLIASRYKDPGNWFSMPIVARLKPGVETEQARTQVEPMLKRFASSHVASERFRRQNLQRADLVSVANGLSALRDEFSAPLRLLMAAVGVLLLIACVNLAGLLVARNAARERELGIRLALGAGRLRIVRQLLTESALLSALGAVPGVLFAFWGSNLLLGFVPAHWGPTTLSVDPDARVLGFAFAATVTTAFLFGLMPAWQATRVAVAPSLNAGSRQTTMLRVGLGRALVVAQFALSLVLLTGAVLFIRTLVNLARVDTGFARDGVLIVKIDAPGTAYTGERLRQFQREMLPRLAALPGVVRVTLATSSPFNGNEDGRRITVHGVTPRGEDDLVAQVNTVGPDYFDVFRVPILQGRPIGVHDETNAPKVAVVSEGFARHYFGSSSALGRQVTLGRGETAEHYEIVGVAGNVRYRNLRAPAPRLVYVAWFQDDRIRDTYFDFALRTAGDPANWINVTQSEIQRLRPDAPILETLTLAELIDSRLLSERLLATLGGFFAIVALTLAAIGVYGLLAYVVARRVPEIGVRLALGARPSMVLWMMLRESLVLGTIGVTVGAAIALVVLRAVGSLLFGLTPSDPATFLIAALLLFGVALLASFIPARRAAAVDPIVALRAE